MSGVTGLSGVTELPTGTRPGLTVPTLPTRTETQPEGRLPRLPRRNADTGPTETVAPEATLRPRAARRGAGSPLALGLALAGLVVGLVVWRRRRAATASWSNQLDDLARRSLAAMDDVLREGSVVTGHVQALAAEARSLEERAADDRVENIRRPHAGAPGRTGRGARG